MSDASWILHQIDYGPSYAVKLLVIVYSISKPTTFTKNSAGADCPATAVEDLHRHRQFVADSLPLRYFILGMYLGIWLKSSILSQMGFMPNSNSFDMKVSFNCRLAIKMAEKNFMQGDARLETTRARFSNLLKRHQQLSERLSRDSDKMIFERLQREFEALRASQTQEVILDGEQWNDGLLATIRERVHMEAERKAMELPVEKTTYKVGTKVICCLERGRIGIQYETSYAGEPCEQYHCVLESKSFLEKLTVLEHSVPFFLPIHEAEKEMLSSNATKFLDYVGDLLQAYVDRREQVRLVKELYGNQIRELYHSLPYQMIEFSLDDSDCKLTVSLRYDDLLSTLPTSISVVAWPVKKSSSDTTSDKKGNVASGSSTEPIRLTYAEDALRTLSLPEAYAEIVLNLPEALEQALPTKESS